MVRNSMKLELIADEAARKISLKKRRKGLLKKVQELSILCGVDACAIVYGPEDRYPEVWPSPDDAARVLMRFRNMPEMEQNKKMMNQEEFLCQKMKKLADQIHKQEIENKEMEKKLQMYEALRSGNFSELDLEQASCLSTMIDLKLKKIYEKIDDVKTQQGLGQGDGGGGGGGGGGVLLQEGTAGNVALNVPMENIAMETFQIRQKQMMELMMPRQNESYQPNSVVGPANNPWPDSLFRFN